MSTFVAVIMAGGSGQRFWPLSTPDKPKQFLDLENSGRTLLQATYDRLRPLVKENAHVMVVTGERYARLVREQLPELPSENIILEPVGRDTAPAVALAALEVEQRFGSVVMGLFTSDHRVGNAVAFQQAMQNAYQLTMDTKGLITIGIQPTYPATGFGYIQAGDVVGTHGFQVDRFVEKPSAEVAQEYLEAGNFFWNNGIFMWYTDTILWELTRYVPDLMQRLTEAFENLKVSEVFPQLPKISIDYAVLERTRKAYVLPADYDWDDLGDWGALERLAHSTDDGEMNTVVGKHIGLDASGNIIYTTSNDDVIVTLGVEDLVVVKRGHTVLVLPKDRSQEIKKLLQDDRVHDLILADVE